MRLLNFEKCVLSKTTIYIFVAAGTVATLNGCQTTTPLSPTNLSTTPIDFSTADSQKNQQQGRAFTTALKANADYYNQLFDQANNPNPEMQAKTQLLSAIRQHLTHEHVAVSQANYHSIPYIKADSIDVGSRGFFRTLLEMYAYKDGNNYDEYSAAEAEEVTEAEVYTADDTDTLEDSDTIRESVEENDNYDESGYDQNVYGREGYDDNGYERDYDDYEHENSNRDLASKIRGINVRGFLNQYEDMQASKAAKGTQNENTIGPYPGVMTQLINMFIRTPEQVQAMNAYHYQYLTLNSVSHYKPKQKQLQSVYSYDFVAPTISSSIQLPIALDFNKSTLTVDPSALLPILALANPEHSPLPEQMTSQTVNFGLPKAATDMTQVPSAVVYDAVIAALQNSMAELDPENFSLIDIRGDAFAKEVGASRAVKVYFGSKQSGEMLGKMIKNVSRSLQQHIDENPNAYSDDSLLKTLIAQIELYNKGYQSADIGSLLQLIEAVSPISFNHINYYYLDSSNQLLAKQQRTNIGSDFFGSQNTLLNQTRYDRASFNKHPLTPLLLQSFGTKAPAAIDGNAWLAKQSEKKERLEKARFARYDYREETAKTSVDDAEDADVFSHDTAEPVSDMDDSDYMDAETSLFEGDN